MEKVIVASCQIWCKVVVGLLLGDEGSVTGQIRVWSEFGRRGLNDGGLMS